MKCNYTPGCQGKAVYFVVGHPDKMACEKCAQRQVVKEHPEYNNNTLKWLLAICVFWLIIMAGLYLSMPYLPNWW